MAVTVRHSNVESNHPYVGPGSERTFTAATINAGDGVPATATYTTAGMWSASTGSLVGGRLTFASTVDLSTRQFLTITITTESYGSDASLDDLANGGLRAIFVDSSGDYAGFKLYGGDAAPIANGITDPAVRMSNGGLGHYANALDVMSAEWVIDLDRTPDYVSGTIDWADIVAVEWVIKPASSASFSCRPSMVGLLDPAIGTGTTSVAEIADTITNSSGGWNWKNLFPAALYKYRGAGLSYTPKIGFQIGNGSTATTWTESGITVGFWDRVEDIADFPWALSLVQLASGVHRLVDVYQSATCAATLTDCVFRSSSGWSWLLRGSASGTLTATRCAFERFEAFTAAHGTYTDCSWTGGGLLSIVAATDITGGTVRDGAGIAIGAAGDFSAIEIEFASNTQDVTLTPTAPGTYNLAGLSKASAITIHNASATHAITVQIAAGQTASTSTAGGVVTVQTAPATVTVNGLVTGSIVKVVRNDTSAVIFTGTETAGAVSFTTSYTGAVTVEARKASAAPFYRPWTTVGTVGSGITFTATQALDQ